MNNKLNVSPDKNIAVSSTLSGPCPPDIKISFKSLKYKINPELIDPDAAKIIKRLNYFGYEAYLVGGCIRDILLGVKPKDFDVATSATPSQIKKIFRNCRLIGRRFRLAHLHFKDNIIEVATFRRGAIDSDDLSKAHAAENLFGNAGDDVLRRDFTINAMMYDIDKELLLDWTGGLTDIQNTKLCSIGNPLRRITEDPVRILRAMKFAEKLNLDIEDEFLAASISKLELLKDVSKSRMLEEILKILRSGSSVKILKSFHKIGIIKIILPNLAEQIDTFGDDFFNILNKCDIDISNGKKLSDTVLLTSLFFSPGMTAINGEGDVLKNLKHLLRNIGHPLPFTKNHMSQTGHIFA
ncbi:MAG: hypothetical protein JXR91_10780, partial [Deltaproteobacteria bacterium]|nr:hypothetical protein [Deltaproteobacteria bacterium]